MASCFRQRTLGPNSSPTVVLPVAGLAGDMMIAVLYAEQLGGQGFQDEAGWARLADVAVGEIFNVASVLSVFSRRATDSEPTSYTFQSGPGGGGTAGTAGIMFAFFDDGGLAVTIDGAVVTAAGATNSNFGFDAPPITPTGSADPFELVLALWWSARGPAPTQLGSILACGLGAGPGTIAAQAYPLARGTTRAPFAAESVGVGYDSWMAFQLALMVSAPSTQRIMLRGVGQAAASTAIPIAVNTLAGDLMVAFARGTNPVTTPAGWSLIGPAQDGGRYGAYQKTAAGDPASYTFANATDGSITSWFHLDGTPLLVDLQSLSGPSSSVASYLGPTLTTSFNNEIVICDWSDGTQSRGITGPTGVLDAGDVWSAINGVTTVDDAELISYFLQVAAGMTTGRTASRSTNAIWYAAQVAIGGGGGGGGGLGGRTLLTFSQC